MVNGLALLIWPIIEGGIALVMRVSPLGQKELVTMLLMQNIAAFMWMEKLICMISAKKSITSQ
jgi:hypothetical protein